MTGALEPAVPCYVMKLGTDDFCACADEREVARRNILYACICSVLSNVTQAGGKVCSLPLQQQCAALCA